MQWCDLTYVSICLRESRMKWRGAGVGDMSAPSNVFLKEYVQDWLDVKFLSLGDSCNRDLL